MTCSTHRAALLLALAATAAPAADRSAAALDAEFLEYLASWEDDADWVVAERASRLPPAEASTTQRVPPRPAPNEETKESSP